MHEDAWVTSSGGPSPSQSQFQAVLASITSVTLRAEFSGCGSDIARFDNFVYARSTGAPLAGDQFASPAGNFSTLARNPDDSFTRTLKNGTQIEYDAAGLMTARVDRNGNATDYGYDGNGNLTTITDPVGLVTTLVYSGGLLTSVTDPAGRVTGFEHDASGDLIKITDTDLSERLFAYDGRHRLTAQTSKRGFATSYDYGPHGRLVQSNLPDGSTRQLAAAQVAGVIDVSAGAGTEANPAPFVRPGDAVSIYTDGNGNTATTELDRFGAPIGITDAAARSFVVVRDDDGKGTRAIAPNGRITDRSYDGRGELHGSKRSCCSSRPINIGRA